MSNLPHGCTDLDIDEHLGDGPVGTCPKCGGDSYNCELDSDAAVRSS